MYKKYIFKVSHLTPIHIGSGEVMTSFDYSVDKIDNENYYCYILNNEEIFNSFTSNEKESFLKLINNNQIPEVKSMLYNVFKELIKENKGYIYKVNTDKAFYEHYNLKITSSANQCSVNLFPRTGLRPYIPGSSIKGALRTIILNDIFKNDQNKLNKAKNYNEIHKLVEGIALDAFKSKNEKLDFDIEKDPFKHLFVSDVLLDNEKNMYIRKVDIYTLGKDNKLKILGNQKNKSGMEINLELADFKDKRLEIVVKDKKFDEICGDLNKLLKFATEHTCKIIKDEYKRLFKNVTDSNFNINDLNKIEKNYTEKLKEIDNIIKKYENTVISNNNSNNINLEFVLRVGRGSGYDAMTIKGLRTINNPQRGKPGQGWGFSKILCDFKPLGLIKLELEKVETIIKENICEQEYTII